MALNTLETTDKISPISPAERIIELISPLIASLGYEVVHVEVQNLRQKILRLFIDFIEPQTDAQGEARAVGIEDCVRVTRHLDEPLENNAEIDALFKGTYELEVSSPGVDRPLRTPKDFERFSGREVRLHIFRPLSAAEMENPQYQEKNPKQKNFLGTLQGIRNGKILLSLNAQAGMPKTPGKRSTKNLRKPPTNSAEVVFIPLPLISKANLEPSFEFDESE